MIIIKDDIPILTPFSNLKDAVSYSKLYKKFSHERIINMVNIKREIDNGCSYGQKIDNYVNNLFS